MHGQSNSTKEYGVKMVCLAGGVSANSYLREQITKKFEKTNIDVIIPPIWCTTDNAAMIAIAGYYQYQKYQTCDDLSLNASASLDLENMYK